MMDLVTIKKFGYRVPKGQTIFQEGDRADRLFLILDGEVEIFIKVKKARKLVATLVKGDIFGEMAVVDAKPRSATAEAVTEVKCLALTRPQLEGIIASNPDFAIKILRMLSGKLREANQIIQYLLSNDREKQVAAAIMSYGKRYGQKTFKGYKVSVRDFVDDSNAQLGLEKNDIKTSVVKLIKDGYLHYAASSKDEVILTEKLERLSN